MVSFINNLICATNYITYSHVALLAWQHPTQPPPLLTMKLFPSDCSFCGGWVCKGLARSRKIRIIFCAKLWDCQRCCHLWTFVELVFVVQDMPVPRPSRSVLQTLCTPKLVRRNPRPSTVGHCCPKDLCTRRLWIVDLVVQSFGSCPAIARLFRQDCRFGTLVPGVSICLRNSLVTCHTRKVLNWIPLLINCLCLRRHCFSQRNSPPQRPFSCKTLPFFGSRRRRRRRKRRRRRRSVR